MQLMSQLTQTEFIIPIVFWAVFTALLSLFIEFCLRERMIFGKWLEWIADWWLINNNPDIVARATELTDKELLEKGEYDSVRNYKFDHVKWFWFKPLGACVVCMNVWIALPFALLLNVNILGQVFMILLSNFLVRLFHNRIL